MYDNIFFIVLTFLINLIFKFVFYIFIILFFLLCIMFLLYFVFLLIPIKYNLDINYINKKLKIKFILNIFFKFLEFSYLEEDMNLKILSFEINKKIKKLKEKKILNNNKEEKIKTEKNIKEEKIKKEKNIKEEEYIFLSKKNNNKKILKIKKFKFKNYIFNIYNKIKYKIKEKFKYIKNIYFKYNFFKNIYTEIKDELFIFLKKIIKRFKITNYNINGEISLKEPDKTGKLLSIISLLKLVFNIDIVSNFEKEVCNLNLKIKGKFNISLILLDTLKFIINKKIRKIIKIILNKNIMKKEGKNNV